MKVRITKMEHSTSQAQGLHGRSKRVHGVVVLGLLISGLTFALAAQPARAARADVPPLERVGTMPFGPIVGAAGYTLTVDPRLERGYALYDAFSRVSVYDLKAMRVITTVPPPPLANYLGEYAGQAYPVVDEKRHHVFFAFKVAATAPPCTEYRLGVLDEASLTWSTRVPACPEGSTCAVGASTPGCDAMNGIGMWFDEDQDRLYILEEDFSANNTNQFGTPLDVYVAVWNASTLQQIGYSKIDCEPRVTPAAPFAEFPMFRHGHDLFVGCQRGNQPLTATTSSEAGSSVIDRIPLDHQGVPVASVESPGVYRSVGLNLSPVADPGSGLVVIVSSQATFDFGAYVQDATNGRFRGFVPTSNDSSFNSPDAPRGAGLDLSRGRLYLRTERALVVSDVRHQPVPVGATYTDLADHFDYQNNINRPGAVGAVQISVDPVRHRLYMPDQRTNSYIIYDDTQGPTADIGTADPDAATVDSPERASVTGETHSGAAGGYGVYLLSDGGPNRIFSNATALCPDIFAGLDQGLLECIQNKVTTPGDRAMYLGRIAQSSLTNVGANGQATSLEVADAATARDLGNAGAYGTTVDPGAGQPPSSTSPTPTPIVLPGARSVTNPTPAPGARPSPGPLDFPIDRPQDVPTCQDFGGSPGSADEHTGVGNAATTCNLARQLVSASAEFGRDDRVPSPPGGVELGSARAWASTTLDPQKGMVSTANATATGIVLQFPDGTVISIDEIAASATSVAHGRPGTADGTYSRTIKGFVAPEYTCGETGFPACDPQQVANAITDALTKAGFDAQAFVPGPDQTYFNGTPGGYQAVVTKDLTLQRSDETVNDDSSDLVPGLEIVFYGDGPGGRTRELLQFAGVHAESHYGIYLLSRGGEPPTPEPLPTLTSTAGPGGGNTTSPPHADGGDGGARKDTGILGVLHHIADIIRETWRLLVSDPATAALLAGFWVLLFTPVYLAVRRRSLVSRISRGVA